MISITDLVAGYGSGNVLDHLSWNLEEGKIHGLVGLNGSGKSTLLKTMYGLVRFDSGEVLWNGKPLNKQFLSLLETEPYFYHGINGEEYLSLFRHDSDHKFNATRWAELFHLPLKKIIDGYSTGMKKKLAILGIIKTNKPVLLLDEPFNGLDMESSRILSAVLKKLSNQGKTIVITSHLMESLSTLSDKIHYLKGGVIQKTYDPEDGLIMNREIFHELDSQIGMDVDKLLDDN